MKTVTAKDIANSLGVSQATVSMVLNNKPGISDARKKEIIEKVNELCCGHMLKKTNPVLKNLGFVVYKRQGDIIDESPFFAYIIEGVTIQAAKKGYQLVMVHINKDMPQKEQEELLLSNACGGLIVFATEMYEDDLAVFKQLNLPYVLLDNYFIHENINTVCIDNSRGITKAVKYLVDAGHKEIGYLQSKVSINSFQERIHMFYNVMNDYTLPVQDKHVFKIGYSEQQAYHDMKNLLLGGAELPTALLADNDWLAFCAMRALRKHGVRIPEDISLIGFDDRPICLYSEPRLTTISVPKDLFGIQAIDLLIDCIESPGKQTITILLGVELIERESVLRIAK